jgi:hypothetical protein
VEFGGVHDFLSGTVTFVPGKSMATASSGVYTLRVGQLQCRRITSSIWRIDNLDSGAIMQRTDGPIYTTVVGGAWELWRSVKEATSQAAQAAARGS